MIYILLVILGLHDFHLSKTEINYDEKTNSLQVATKVFIDDLQSELSLYGIPDLKLATETEASNADSILAIYFSEKLELKIDGNTVNQDYLGKELSEDLLAIWAYIEVPLASKPEYFSVHNSIMTDLYDDQKNMVVIKKNNRMVEHEILDEDNRVAAVVW